MGYDLTSFERGLSELEITLSDSQKQQFLRYYEYLIEVNQVMNLTAITEYEEVIAKHFLDSLALVKASCFSTKGLTNKKLIDVGTGAGFPGIPLKIAFPELEITLLDSLNKRVNFLKNTIEMLGLPGISAIHARAEDAAQQKEYREKFDFCVSRAVANLSTLSEYCLPFVAKKGRFISYKSGTVDQEFAQAKKAVQLLGGETEEVVRFSLANTDSERSLVVIRKVKPTPGRYPRKAGLPVREPLA